MFEMQKKDNIKESHKNVKTNKTGIPSQMKSQFENYSGYSFDDVKVYYGSGKPKEMQALAYTQGNNVYIGPGQEQHLAHELGHVVQQKQGIVKATEMVKGIAVNTDLGLEKNADYIAANALQEL